MHNEAITLRDRASNFIPEVEEFVSSGRIPDPVTCSMRSEGREERTTVRVAEHIGVGWE